MFKRLATALLLRRVSRDLSALVAAVERQNIFLGRLVDRFCLPVDPSATDRAVVTHDTGVTYLDEVDAALAEGYVARTLSDTGHHPDDEEVAIYLTDEKTTDLRDRLIAREAELTRLMESRR